VFKTLKANADTSRHVVASILEDLQNAINSKEEGQGLLLGEVGTMQYSIMPRSEQQNPEDRKKLAFILPEYFSE